MRNLIPMYVKMQTKMQSMLRGEKGATMVEYALMVALIAVVALLSVTTLGTNVSGRFGQIATSIGVAP